MLEELLEKNSQIIKKDFLDPWFNSPRGYLKKPDYNRPTQDVTNVNKKPIFSNFWSKTPYESYWFAFDIPSKTLRFYKDDDESNNASNAIGFIDFKDNIFAIEISVVYDAPPFSLDLISATKHYTITADSEIAMIRWAYILNENIVHKELSIQDEEKKNKRESLKTSKSAATAPTAAAFSLFSQNRLKRSKEVSKPSVASNLSTNSKSTSNKSIPEEVIITTINDDEINHDNHTLVTPIISTPTTPVATIPKKETSISSKASNNNNNNKNNSNYDDGEVEFSYSESYKNKEDDIIHSSIPAASSSYSLKRPLSPVKANHSNITEKDKTTNINDDDNKSPFSNSSSNSSKKSATLSPPSSSASAALATSYTNSFHTTQTSMHAANPLLIRQPLSQNPSHVVIAANHTTTMNNTNSPLKKQLNNNNNNNNNNNTINKNIINAFDINKNIFSSSPISSHHTQSSPIQQPPVVYYEYNVTFQDPGPLMLNVMGTADRNKNGNMTNNQIVVVSFEYYSNGKVGRAESTGLIQVTDLLIGINDEKDLVKYSFNESMDILMDATWPKTLYFKRDMTMNKEFSRIESWAYVYYPSIIRRRRRYIDLTKNFINFRKPAMQGSISSKKDAFFKIDQIAQIRPIMDKTVPNDQQFTLQLICKANSVMHHVDENTGNLVGASQVEILELCFPKQHYLNAWRSVLMSANLNNVLNSNNGGISNNINNNNTLTNNNSNNNNASNANKMNGLENPFTAVPSSVPLLQAPMTKIGIRNALTNTFAYRDFTLTPDGYLQWKKHEPFIIPVSSSSSSSTNSSMNNKNKHNVEMINNDQFWFNQDNSTWYKKSRTLFIANATSCVLKSIRLLEDSELYNLEFRYQLVIETTTANVTMGMRDQKVLLQWAQAIRELVMATPAGKKAKINFPTGIEKARVLSPPLETDDVDDNYVPMTSPSSRIKQMHMINSLHQNDNHITFNNNNTTNTNTTTNNKQKQNSSKKNQSSSSSLSLQGFLYKKGEKKKSNSSTHHFLNLNNILTGNSSSSSSSSDKDASQNSKFHKRWFVLKDLELMYFRSPNESSNKDFSLGSLDLSHVIEVREAVDASVPENAFEIVTSTSSHSATAAVAALSAAAVLRPSLSGGSGTHTNGGLNSPTRMRPNANTSMNSRHQRIHLLVAENEDDQAKWIEALTIKIEENREKLTNARHAHRTFAFLGSSSSSNNNNHITHGNGGNNSPRSPSNKQKNGKDSPLPFSSSSPSSKKAMIMNDSNNDDDDDDDDEDSVINTNRAEVLRLAIICASMLTKKIIHPKTAVVTWKEQYFVIANDSLSYYQNASDYYDEDTTAIAEIPLVNITHICSTTDPTCPHTGFEITALTRRGGDAKGVRVFTLKAATPEMCVEWMTALCHAIGTLDLIYKDNKNKDIMNDNKDVNTSVTTGATSPTGGSGKYYSKVNFEAVKQREKARLQASLFKSPGMSSKVRKAAGVMSNTGNDDDEVDWDSITEEQKHVRSLLTMDRRVTHLNNQALAGRGGRGGGGSGSSNYGSTGDLRASIATSTSSTSPARRNSLIAGRPSQHSNAYHYDINTSGTSGSNGYENNSSPEYTGSGNTNNNNATTAAPRNSNLSNTNTNTNRAVRSFSRSTNSLSQTLLNEMHITNGSIYNEDERYTLFNYNTTSICDELTRLSISPGGGAGGNRRRGMSNAHMGAGRGNRQAIMNSRSTSNMNNHINSNNNSNNLAMNEMEDTNNDIDNDNNNDVASVKSFNEMEDIDNTPPPSPSSSNVTGVHVTGATGLRVSPPRSEVKQL